MKLVVGSQFGHRQRSNRDSIGKKTKKRTDGERGSDRRSRSRKWWHRTFPTSVGQWQCAHVIASTHRDVWNEHHAITDPTKRSENTESAKKRRIRRRGEGDGRRMRERKMSGLFFHKSVGRWQHAQRARPPIAACGSSSQHIQAPHSPPRRPVRHEWGTRLHVRRWPRQTEKTADTT